MSEHLEGHPPAYERIRSKKTLAEILQVATEFERKACQFYSALIPKVRKHIRYLVEELAAEEKAHYERFQRLAEDPEVQQQIQARIQAPVEDHRFSDYIHLPEFGENPDDQAILQYALGREDAAMKQYRELAHSVPEGPIRQLFDFLADEETQHKRELEKTYYELVFGGGRMVPRV